MHLSDALWNKAVALLTARELKRWRDGLKKAVSIGSINRICNGLRAALNLAADTDERITSRRAWEVGLQAIRDATVARNVILSAEAIRRIVEEAYGIGPEFGLLVETLAVTGARVVSQVARLDVQDVQGDRSDPRLMMPSSKKGRGQRKVLRRPVPIPESLAIRLRQAGQHRADTAPLLVKPSGAPWRRSDHTRLFARAVRRAGLDPAEVTIYALRHSQHRAPTSGQRADPRRGGGSRHLGPDDRADLREAHRRSCRHVDAACPARSGGAGAEGRQRRATQTMKKFIPASAQLRITTTAPIVVVAPTVKQLLDRVAKGKKVRPIDLARVLAAISAFQTGRGRVPAEFQSATNAPVPVEILAIVGEKLVGRSRYAAAYNENRAKLARDRNARLQHEADKIWQRHPGLSKSAVAKRIAPNDKRARRKITKPKK